MIGKINSGDKHTIYFEATEKNHRYIIKTHGCNKNSKCIAAYRKGNVKIMFVLIIFYLFFNVMRKK